ncbi:MAG: hypothetical protein MSIBF_04125 [Candidatus Altiarchaeales archaeon IMC4]|nr:MAG: hypothetical protein MSIBF_04125 [Candidatus Altiarchaeales archaeon IMC4]
MTTAENTTVKGLHPSFGHGKYLFRKKVLKLFGGAFHVYDENGNVLFYSKQKAFKLKEDFRVYSDEAQTSELLVIKTPQILDFGATYNVQDGTVGEVVGAMRRKGLKSIVKDEWLILSKDGGEVGKLTEKSTGMAILSRLVGLIPQKYVIVAKDGSEVANIEQHFNPFVLKYTMTISPQPKIDRRLLIAVGILLVGIEGRQ